MVEAYGEVSGLPDADGFQSAVRIAVWLKRPSTTRVGSLEVFQSAVRIAVWLKCASGRASEGYLLVSIRRADRCLVEGVRFALTGTVSDVVSIRRADRCLVEVTTTTLITGATEFQSAVRIAVWLKPFQAKRPTTAASSFQSAVRIAVWLKQTVSATVTVASEFQSAVRIAVWLKEDDALVTKTVTDVSIRRADRCLVEEVTSTLTDMAQLCFNPPCGSLFG